MKNLRAQRQNQGDVLVLPIAELPKGLKPLSGNGSKTLAYGEHTGHHHTFTDGDVCLYEDTNGQKYAEIFTPSTLTHQEHNQIMYSPGVYKIGIVRQYDYDTEESKRVRD